MSIADFFFGRKQNKTNSRRSAKLNRNAVRTRTLSMEPLETRDLLSVTTGPIDADDYAALREQYPDFNLPADQSTLNVMTVDLDEGATALKLSDLKSAISNAASSTKPDLILVKTTDSANTISYSSSSDQISINVDASQYGSVTIIGWGEQIFTLDANQQSRVMSISGASTVVNLGGLGIQNGSADLGGGIFLNSGILTISNSIISDNSATSGDGGGIRVDNAGNLSVINSTVSYNTSSQNGGGMDLYNDSTLLLKNSNVVHNTANGDGGGIGIATSSASMMNSVFSNNSAESVGGGFYSYKTSITMSGCTFIENSSNKGGGAIYNNSADLTAVNSEITSNTSLSDGGGIRTESAGTMSLTNCKISNNFASGNGGGIDIYHRTYLTIIDCIVSNNVSERDGGGISFTNSRNLINIINSYITNNTASGFGGGIINGEYGTVAISNSEITGNVSNMGGGIGNKGIITVINCTIARNNSTNYGGGICNLSTNISNIYNSIIVLNSLDVYMSSDTLNAYNTLSSYSSWSNNSNNIIFDNSKPLFVSSSNYHLADNSQAINKGNNSYAVDETEQPLTSDLAGIPRILGTSVDIGAFEYDSRTPLSIPEFTVEVNETSATINISPVDNAIAYRIEYSTDSDFMNSSVIDVQAGENILDDLQELQEYFIRVKSIGYILDNTYTNSINSDAKSFFIPALLTELTLSTNTPFVGTTITTTLDPEDATVEYQWYIGEEPISGATSSSYTVTADQLGQTIKCVATATGDYIGTAFAEATVVAPDGYSEADYQKMVVFLEQTDEDGVKNGVKLNPDYDPADPTTWEFEDDWGCWYGVEWTEADDELRISALNLYDLSLVGEADFSDMTSLTEIDVDNNLITSLNLSGCTELTEFSCFFTDELTTLNVSGCTSLTELSCQDNPNLASLDASGCTELTTISLSNNALTSLDISDCPALSSLSCYDTQMTSLDLSGNTSLTTLNCSYNSNLTSIDVSDCTSLTTLVCPDNREMTSLDVSGCTSLTTLGFSETQLTSLDVSGCTSLTTLSILENDLLESLNVSGCTSLTSLVCPYNNLTSLDVSGCTSLTTLNCSSNPLATLDASGCTSLTTLNSGSDPLTSLNVAGCTSLTSLTCSSNLLTSLDVSENTALTELSCIGCSLTTLDVSNNTELTSLNCSGNDLTSLDVSNNTALTTLYCNSNELTSLDVSACTALTTLVCKSNQLTSLTVSPSITYLECNSNQLTSLNLSANKKLKWLFIGDSYLSVVLLSEDAIGTLSVNFRDSSYDVTNSQGTETVAKSTSFQPTELPFTAVNTTTGNTILFDSHFHLTGLTLSTDAPEVGTTIMAELNPADATVTFVWLSGSTPVENATSSSFTVTEEQIGQTITCVAIGTGDYAGTVFATTLAVPGFDLDVPAGLALSAAETTVTAAWSPVENASSYTMEYQAAGSDAWTTIPDVQGTSASFSGAAGTTYNVRVKANGTGNYADSEYCEIEQITLDEVNKPIIAVNGKKISVLWTDASLAADSVRYRVAGTNKWTVKKLKEGVTEFSFNGALGTSYDIEVLLDQQENNVLQGSATILDQPKLKADKAFLKDDTFQVSVTNYAAKNLATNSKQAIVIVNGVQTTFNIDNQEGSAELTNGGSVAFANGLFTFTEMNCNTSYKVQISFSDGVSYSTLSSALTVKTTKACYLAPVITTATAVSDTSIVVAWQTAKGKNSDTEAQKYTVQYSLDGVKWTNATTAATGNAYTIQKLKGGAVYQVRVFATKDNAFEASVPSDVLTAETLAAPKTAIEKNSITDDSFQLNVSNYRTTNLPKATVVNVKSDKFGETVINLEDGSGSAAFDNGMTVAFNNGALTFANVPSNTQQKIQINFSDGVCTTAWSAALTVKTAIASYNKPILTNAEAVSSTSVLVEWSPAVGKNSDIPAQSYTVQYSTDGNRWTNANTKVVGTSFTITGLKTGTTYLVAVIANKDSRFNASLPSESRQVTPL